MQIKALVNMFSSSGIMGRMDKFIDLWDIEHDFRAPTKTKRSGGSSLNKIALASIFWDSSENIASIIHFYINSGSILLIIWAAVGLFMVVFSKLLLFFENTGSLLLWLSTRNLMIRPCAWPQLGWISIRTFSQLKQKEVTPTKNERLAPENWFVEEEIPIGNHHFGSLC